MLKDFQCLEESCAKEVLRERGLGSASRRLAAIHDGVRGIPGGAGLAAMHGTLETFEGLGAVRRLHFPAGESGYAFSRAGRARHMVRFACGGRGEAAP